MLFNFSKTAEANPLSPGKGGRGIGEYQMWKKGVLHNGHSHDVNCPSKKGRGNADPFLVWTIYTSWNVPLCEGCKLHSLGFQNEAICNPLALLFFFPWKEVWNHWFHYKIKCWRRRRQLSFSFWSKKNGLKFWPMCRFFSFGRSICRGEALKTLRKKRSWSISSFFFALTILALFIFVFVSYKSAVFCFVVIVLVLGLFLLNWQLRCYAWFLCTGASRVKGWLKIFSKKKAKFIFSSLKEPILV